MRIAIHSSYPLFNPRQFEVADKAYQISRLFLVPDRHQPGVAYKHSNSVQRIAIMAALQNASFTSPLAQASFAKLASPSVLDEVFSTITGLSGWTIALAVFLGLVLYDQCEFEFLRILFALSYFSILTNGILGSYLMAEGLHCRTDIQNPLHWAVPPIYESKIL